MIPAALPILLSISGSVMLCSIPSLCLLLCLWSVLYTYKMTSYCIRL